MHSTSDRQMHALLDHVLSAIQGVLGGRLVGLYLYGSLVAGDFDADTSDIDLLAAMADDVSDEDLPRLGLMHQQFASTHPVWRDRIEVQYLSTGGLRTFRSTPRRMAVISPGDPLHFVDGDIDWLVNWYLVRESGVSLVGPSPRILIDAISKQEFVRAVCQGALPWREHVMNTKNSRPFQAYAILTMCRTLYTAVHGEAVSKRKASSWAQLYMPAWSSLIADALLWRTDWRNQQVDATATFPQTVRFVNHVVDQITCP